MTSLTDVAMTDIRADQEEVERAPPDDDGGSVDAMSSPMTSPPARDLVSPCDLVVKEEFTGDEGLDMNAPPPVPGDSGTLLGDDGVQPGSWPEQHDGSRTSPRPRVSDWPSDRHNDDGKNDFLSKVANVAAAAAAAVMASCGGTESTTCTADLVGLSSMASAAMDQAGTLPAGTDGGPAAAGINHHVVEHCRVCGDEATGMYFGALVCVPCKVLYGLHRSTLHSLYISLLFARS